MLSDFPGVWRQGLSFGGLRKSGFGVQGLAILEDQGTWFPSSLVEIRVPLFLLFGFNQGTPKEKRAKGSYWATWENQNRGHDLQLLSRTGGV